MSHFFTLNDTTANISHCSLETEGNDILTALVKAKRLPQPAKHIELERLEEDADRFRSNARIWATQVLVSAQCSYFDASSYLHFL